jgi:hypothetical protein
MRHSGLVWCSSQSYRWRHPALPSPPPIHPFSRTQENGHAIISGHAEVISALVRPLIRVPTLLPLARLAGLTPSQAPVLFPPASVNYRPTYPSQQCGLRTLKPVG